MHTTIQVKGKVKETLDRMKMHPRESYNEVLERMIEDLSELDEETKKDIEEAIKAYKEGKYKTHEQVKQELGS